MNNCNDVNCESSNEELKMCDNVKLELHLRHLAIRITRENCVVIYLAN